MALDPTQQQTLKTDIAAGGAGTNTTITPSMPPSAVAAIYNDPAETSPAATVEPSFASANDLQQAVVPADWEARMGVGVGATLLSLITAQERQALWLAILTAAAEGDTSGVPIRDPQIRQQVQHIWAGTATLANIAALQTRPATPAEVLFGIDVAVSVEDVRRALVLP